MKISCHMGGENPIILLTEGNSIGHTYSIENLERAERERQYKNPETIILSLYFFEISSFK